MKSFRWLVLISLVSTPLFASTVTIYYQRAIEAYLDKNYDAALDDINTVLANDPSHWKALEIQAYCFYRKGYKEECYQSCLESLKLHSNNPPLKEFADRLEKGEAPSKAELELRLPKDLAALPPPPDEDGTQLTDGDEPLSPALVRSSKAKVKTELNSSVPRKTALEIGPLVSFPISTNANAQFLPGPGVEANVMFPTTDHQAMGFDVGFQSCPLNKAYVSNQFQDEYGGPIPPSVSIGGNLTYVPIMFMIKYCPEKLNQGVYVIGGVGLALNSINVNISGTNTVTISAEETDFLCAFGAGFDFKISDVEGFIQARMDLDYTSGKNDTITLSGPGVSATGIGSLTGDNPTLFLPLQVGLRI